MNFSFGFSFLSCTIGIILPQMKLQSTSSWLQPFKFLLIQEANICTYELEPVLHTSCMENSIQIPYVYKLLSFCKVLFTLWKGLQSIQKQRWYKMLKDSYDTIYTLPFSNRSVGERSNEITLYGFFPLEFCNWMLLCCLEGPEGGNGIAFGKKPKKFWDKPWDFGCMLKTWVCLEP